jgi:hypothetical protein
MSVQISRIQREIRRLESLLNQAAATKKSSGQVEVEGLMNKAMDSIETIKKAGKNHKRETDKAMVSAFELYQRLQRLAREPDFYIGTDRNHPHRVTHLPPTTSNIYSHVRWDAAAMMAVPKREAEQWNPYWRPPKKAAPCYTYTQEELDKLDPNRKKKCQK